MLSMFHSSVLVLSRQMECPCFGAQATWQHIAAPLIRSNSRSKQTTAAAAAAHGRHISSFFFSSSYKLWHLTSSNQQTKHASGLIHGQWTHLRQQSHDSKLDWWCLMSHLALWEELNCQSKSINTAVQAEVPVQAVKCPEVLLWESDLKVWVQVSHVPHLLWAEPLVRRKQMSQLHSRETKLLMIHSFI